MAAVTAAQVEPYPLQELLVLRGQQYILEEVVVALAMVSLQLLGVLAAVMVAVEAVALRLQYLPEELELVALLLSITLPYHQQTHPIFS
jgi:hypothetical protein